MWGWVDAKIYTLKNCRNCCTKYVGDRMGVGDLGNGVWSGG